MNPLQLVKCIAGFHQRDSRKATRNDAGLFVSVCTGCGVTMWRYLDGWTTTQRNVAEIATSSPKESMLPVAKERILVTEASPAPAIFMKRRLTDRKLDND